MSFFTPLRTAILLATISLVTFIFISGDRLAYILYSDALGYYQYLPGVFIEHDLSCLYYAIEIDFDKNLNVFHIGVAIMQMPFFLITHALAYPLGYEPDGYSSIYVYGIAVSASFYLGLGTYLLQKFLLFSFSKGISALTVILLFCCTNLYYYASFEVGMSHVYSFALFAALIYFSHVFFQHPNYKTAIKMGLVYAIILVIRPNNGIIILLSSFYGVNSFSMIGIRIKWWLSNFKYIVVIMIPIFALVFIQMSYWKYITGNWVEFSYGRLGQEFYWSKAQMANVLFSVQNGLFIYAPLLLFAILGLLIGVLKKQINHLLYLMVWVIAWYIFASWWCWWFGGAYGHRAFIDYFPLMAIGLGVFIQHVHTRAYFLYPSIILGSLFIFINLRMCYLYQWPWNDPNWHWENYVSVLRQMFFS